MRTSLTHLAMLLPIFLSAQAMAEPNTNLKLLELEAELETVKTELSGVKAMAEQERPSAFNPSISVIGALLGQYGLGVPEDDDEFSNGVAVRELEFEFRGAIDPFADALVTIALHEGHKDVHIEDAYLRFKKWPGLSYAPLGLEMRVGRSAGAFGRMNRLHSHNTNQINYPLALQRFLGHEGFKSQGLSFRTTLALSETSALTFFFEGLMGSKTPLQKKEANEIPVGLFHAWWHQEMASNHYLDVGFSKLVGRRGEKDSGVLLQMGSDIHYGYMPAGYGQDPVFIAGNEFFIANRAEGKDWPIGNFTWAQVRLCNATFLGARYDLAPHEKNWAELEHSLSGYLSYYTSEFLRLRFGYEHRMPELKSFSGDHRFMMSAIFVLGSHPMEPYYATR